MFGPEFLLGDGDFLLGRRESLSLWRYFLVYLIELYDGADPFAQTFCGLGGTSDDFGLEVRVSKIGFNLFYDGWVYVFLFVVL